MMDIQLEQIAQGARETVAAFFNALPDEVTGQLRAGLVVGEACQVDFLPGRSAIDTMLLLERVDGETLMGVRTAWRPLAKRGLQVPLVVTEPEWRDSLDAYPVEFLQVQLSGTVVAGDLDLAEVAISRDDLRLQCERELRGLLLQTRLAAIGAGVAPRRLGAVLAAGSGRLLTVLRAVEWLAGGVGTGPLASLIPRLGATLGVDGGALQILVDQRRKRTWKVTPEQFMRLTRFLEALVAWVDTHQPGAADA